MAQPTDRSPLLHLGTAFLVTAVCTLAFAMTGALRFGWNASTLRTIVRALPVPVAMVDSQTVTYRAWDDLRAAQRTYQNRLASVQGVAAPSSEEIGRQALDAAIRLSVTQGLAHGYGVTVSTAEVQQQLQRSIDLASDPGTLERIVREYYGWDVATLIRTVIEPYLLRSKLDDAIAADTTLGEDPQAKADRVHALLAADGADFEAIAKQESEDPTTRTSGGSTLITRATFEDSATTEALFNLKDGALSEPFVSGSAIFIVRVDRTITDDASGDAVLQAHVVTIRRRNVDTQVAARLLSKPPRIFLAPFRWDAIDGCVVGPATGCRAN